ncbi:MAG TPA: hypothetical protein VK171_07570, partial [Fimbriimonas sp.]|nr:hypothetical protein [Fimbriimonas sp.]
VLLWSHSPGSFLTGPSSPKGQPLCGEFSEDKEGLGCRVWGAANFLQSGWLPTSPLGKLVLSSL